MTWEEAVVWLRGQPEQSELVKQCYFDDPVLEAAMRFFKSSEWEATRSLMPAAEKGRVLDLGAGRGISSFALAKDDWETTALEPDGSKLVGAQAIRDLAELAGLKIQVVQKWGEELPFDSGDFDLVYCRQVLHHARDLGQICREIGRVLRCGGVFVATREHVISRSEDLDRFLSQHPLHTLYGGERAYLLDQYTSAIRAAGLKIQHVLNPFKSDVNLYPETRSSFKARLARKTRWPWPETIPDRLLDFLGYWVQTPGRLYSFVAYKPG
jgi:SAM-dependent methyltransferase